MSDAGRLCTKCNTTKPVEEFYGRKGRNGVWRPVCCKPCHAADQRAYRRTESYAEWTTEYNRSDSRKAQNARHDQSEKGKARRKRYDNSAHGKIQRSATNKKWRSQPGNRAIASMTEKLRRTIVIPGYHSSVLEVMNATRAEFIARMEETWVPGMSWDNYGYRDGDYDTGWDVDHIIPKSLYDHTDEADMARCWQLGNLQSMWHVDNLRKSDNTSGWRRVPAHLWPKMWNGCPPSV